MYDTTVWCEEYAIYIITLFWKWMLSWKNLELIDMRRKNLTKKNNWCCKCTQLLIKLFKVFDHQIEMVSIACSMLNDLIALHDALLFKPAVQQNRQPVAKTIHCCRILSINKKYAANDIVKRTIYSAWPRMPHIIII